MYSATWLFSQIVHYCGNSIWYHVFEGLLESALNISMVSIRDKTSDSCLKQRKKTQNPFLWIAFGASGSGSLTKTHHYNARHFSCATLNKWRTIITNEPTTITPINKFQSTSTDLWNIVSINFYRYSSAIISFQISKGEYKYALQWQRHL